MPRFSPVLFLIFFTFLARLFFSTFFFFNDTATTEIYTLSLHDALPISARSRPPPRPWWCTPTRSPTGSAGSSRDRKSTRLNSSHVEISHAVFSLKKKNRTGTVNRRSCARSTNQCPEASHRAGLHMTVRQ